MGIQVNGTTQPQPMNGVTFGQPTINNYVGSPKASEPDTYQGKSLTGKVVKWGAFATTIAGLLLFHKNIGAFTSRKLPGFSKWCQKHIGKDIKSFSSHHKKSWYVRWTSATKNKFGEWGDNIITWFKTPAKEVAKK